MSAQDYKAHTTLLRAYLLSMLGVAVLFVILASGIWVYTDDVLNSEKTLISELLPDLDSAYQLTASTASLQSKGSLLSAANDNEELSARHSALSETVQQSRQAIDSLDINNVDQLAALSSELDNISGSVDDLVAVRSGQLKLELTIDSEKIHVLEQMQALEKLMQLRVITLTDRSYDTDSAIAGSDEMKSELAASGVDSAQTLTDIITNYDVTNLAIQDYLLLEQGVVSLSALVERLPLLTTDAAIDVAEHERDFLISSLVSRSIYLGADENTDELLLALRDIRTQLLQEEGLFAMKRLNLMQTNYQDLLDRQMQNGITALLADTNKIRNDLRDTVNELATVTLSVLDRYRLFLVSLTVITLAALALISYWLLYRKTVLPLVQITDQLETVGTDRFPMTTQPYLLLELSKLAQAMSQLNTVQKDLLHKDREMQRINRDLQKANQELGQFAHVASHDLQEPLRKLKQFSDLLEEDYESLLDEEGRYYLSAIRNAAKRMSILIKETLAYSRAGSANQELEDVDLAALIAQLRDEMDLTIKEAAATFQVEPLPVVCANRLGMAQLFRNLLVNALKYRKQGMPANITITTESLIEPDGQFVAVRVRDAGVGIHEKFLERIFNPFERAHAGEVHGTGLGLAICKKVCESHEWTLSVQSTVNEGATFTVQIPISSLRT